MNNNINVGSEKIAQGLGNFQSEMTKMNKLFEELKTKTAEVSQYWTGTDSDNTLTELTAFMALFEEIDSQNKKYVNFLNNVINRYTATEKAISATIDAAANSSLGINGSGN